MTIKKQRVISRSVGRQTKKKTGYITTSIRLLVEENKRLRKAAAIKGFSFNMWAINTLLEAAKETENNG
jgi:uncharacterized protein (DUF1778 family)